MPPTDGSAPRRAGTDRTGRARDAARPGPVLPPGRGPVHPQTLFLTRAEERRRRQMLCKAKMWAGAMAEALARGLILAEEETAQQGMLFAKCSPAVRPVVARPGKMSMCMC